MPIEAEPREVTVAPFTSAQPRLLALLCCDYASNSDEGKASVAGIFDRLLVPTIPGQSPPFFLYFRTTGTEGGTLRVLLWAPNGQETAAVALETPSLGPSDAPPMFVQGLMKTSFAVREAGVYWFGVEFDGILLGTAPMRVEQKPVADVNSNEA